MSATGRSLSFSTARVREAGRFHTASQSLSLFGVMEKMQTCSVLGELDFVASKVSLSFCRTVKIEFCRETTFYLEILQRDKVGVGYWQISQPPVMPQDHGLFSAGDTRSRGGSPGWSEVPFLPWLWTLSFPHITPGWAWKWLRAAAPETGEWAWERVAEMRGAAGQREKGRVIRAPTPPVLRICGDAQAQLAPWRTAGLSTEV